MDEIGNIRQIPSHDPQRNPQQRKPRTEFPDIAGATTSASGAEDGAGKRPTAAPTSARPESAAPGVDTRAKNSPTAAPVDGKQPEGYKRIDLWV